MAFSMFSITKFRLGFKNLVAPVKSFKGSEETRVSET